MVYDHSKVVEAADYVNMRVMEEAKLYENDYSKIFIGGYYTGGIVALYTFLLKL